MGISALLSCVRVEPTPVREAVPITYQAVVGLAGDGITRAGDTDGAVYPTDKSFNTVAYLNVPGNTTRADATQYIPKSGSVAEVSYNTYWKTTETYVWPMISSLTFMGYSPAKGLDSNDNEVDLSTKITMNRDGITVDNWNSEEAPFKGVDFMIADIQTGKNSNELNGGYSGVPMVFRHMLTKVKITVVKSNDREIKVNSIKLTDVRTEGDFSALISGTTWGSLYPVWTADNTSVQDLSFAPASGLEWVNAGETTLELPVLEGYYAIPQNTSGTSEIIINYDDSTVGSNQTQSEYLSVFHSKWERGTMVHYRIIIGAKKEIQFEGSSDDWSDDVGGGSDIII